MELGGWAENLRGAVNVHLPNSSFGGMCLVGCEEKRTFRLWEPVGKIETKGGIHQTAQPSHSDVLTVTSNMKKPYL